MVCLPESAVDADEIHDLGEVLARRGVTAVIAGVRERTSRTGQFPRNWVHIGFSLGDQWIRLRQNKHHRWSLDERQIDQYHLGGTLHPRFRWWEAMQVPRRSIQFVEVGAGVTLASLVCEVLAQIDEVAEVLRSVGPTIVVTPLLDGPQLSSRWAARYASVMADDPGSAVLTLISSGMAQRSRPRGHDSSPVVALWKDSVHGTREIPLEAGAHGILLTATAALTSRRSGDGRSPVENCVEFFKVGIHQVRASNEASSPPNSASATPTGTTLQSDELTILRSWAEAVAEALASAPERTPAAMADALTGAKWRTELQIAEPSARRSEATACTHQPVRDIIDQGAEPSIDRVLAALRNTQQRQPEHDGLALRVLQSALEQRQAHEHTQPGSPGDEPILR
ncbi:MAG TPA: hypothetical protein VKB37_11570 [Jatrophihabitantaceae bacterium]|nr:hypothetical protein [Jatrophihabitantaceae bacterium]